MANILDRYNQFREKIAQMFSQVTQQMVDKAIIYADSHLSELIRYNGRPMLDHAIGVAYIVATEVGLGRNSTVSAIIHDVIRLAAKSGDNQRLEQLLTECKELFGEEVVGIVSGLANISELQFNTHKEQASSFRDMIVAYSEDPRVILIKLADRLEVMRSIAIFPEAKRKKKSWESLNLYAQIAHKLGLYNIKSELEDLALSQLEPEAYTHIVDKLAESEQERMAFIEQFLEPIRKAMDNAGINYHIKSRTKSVYSIWNKMRKQQVPFEGVYDIFALRIIIDCPKEQEKAQCWLVYSIVSDFYTPNTDRMRDWITIPKSNGYESLHTTVSAGDGKWVEIQIRTERMDDVAELGIAAHWRYKGVNQGAQTSEQWLQRLRELMDETKEDIAERFDAKPASGEIFVFTPNGDIRKLPEGATVLDFAFDIHTNLGSTCSGGKVNGRAVPIREQLKNGDIVEIMTQKNQQPKADWLNFVVTTKARQRIKAFIREEQAKNAKLGREELERKLKNWKLTAKSIDEVVAYLCKYYKQRTGTALYELIATEKIDLSTVKEIISRWLSGEADEERRAAEAAAERVRRESQHQPTKQTASDALIIDEDINNIVYKLAKCCNPIKGDDIFGFVTINTGITIHRCDCPNAKHIRKNYPYRIMEAKWREQAQGSFRVTIAITINDTAGVVNQITEVVSRDLKLNIRTINLSSRGDGTGVGTISVEVPSTSVVDMLLHAIMRIKGVQRAVRVNN